MIMGTFLLSLAAGASTGERVAVEGSAAASSWSLTLSVRDEGGVLVSMGNGGDICTREEDRVARRSPFEVKLRRASVLIDVVCEGGTPLGLETMTHTPSGAVIIRSAGYPASTPPRQIEFIITDSVEHGLHRRDVPISVRLTAVGPE